MRHKITGTHLKYELLFQCPVAFVIESGGKSHHRIIGVHIRYSVLNRFKVRQKIIPSKQKKSLYSRLVIFKTKTT